MWLHLQQRMEFAVRKFSPFCWEKSLLNEAHLTKTEYEKLKIIKIGKLDSLNVYEYVDNCIALELPMKEKYAILKT